MKTKRNTRDSGNQRFMKLSRRTRGRGATYCSLLRPMPCPCSQQNKAGGTTNAYKTTFHNFIAYAYHSSQLTIPRHYSLCHWKRKDRKSLPGLPSANPCIISLCMLLQTVDNSAQNVVVHS